MRTTSQTLPPRKAALLARVVAAADQFVPLYRQLWSSAGIDVRRLQLPAEFSQLPVVTKVDLRQFSAEQRTDRRFLQRRLNKETTSGSSGHPLEVHIDAGSLWRRRRRTWMGLWRGGYRPGQRFLWLKHLSTGAAGRPSLLGRLANLDYVNVNADEQSVVSQYRSRRPDLLYGQLSALSLLAQSTDATTKQTTRPSIIISFGEQLTPSLRDFISTRLGADVTDFYGTTEVGLIACRRPDEAAYCTVDPDLLLEFLPAPDAPGFERLVVTNLGGGAMPFIRYDTGDMVRRDHALPERPILEMAGRVLDFFLLPDGRRIAPYRIDASLDEIEGLFQYRVVQKADFSIDMHIVVQQRAADAVMADATRAITDLCGPTIPVRTHLEHRLQTTAFDKLRAIQSLAVPRQ